MSRRFSYPAHLWLLVLLPYAWFVERYRHLIDDAFISFRYAHHWASGEGLRYNLGEAEPVEGFSNFLWVALLTLGELVGVAPEHFSLIAGLACGVTLLALVYRFALRTLELGTLPAFSAALFLGCFPAFTVWSTGGMETTAFALALFAAWTELVRPQGPRYGRAALFALAVSTLRPEGAAWALGLVLAGGVARGREGLDLRILKRYLLPVLVGLGILLAARWVYYHDWLPNTARAKGNLSGDVLLRGLKNAASYFAIFLSPILILGLAPLACRLPKGRIVASATLMLGSGFLWSIFVGGDWMPYFRFFAPLTPFLALLFGAGLARLRRAGVPLAVGSIALAVLPVFDWLLVPRNLRESIYFRYFPARGFETENERWRSGVRNGERFTRIGKALAEIAEPGDSLVQGAIGAVGYYSGVTIHDRNGLVDREVARQEVSKVRSAGHDKRVPRMFFAGRKPTWFDVRLAPANLPKQEIWGYMAPSVLQDEADRRLLEVSEPQVVPVRGGGADHPPFTLLLYRRVESRERARRGWQSVGLR